MVEITAQMVAALRSKTGAGLIDCKKALAESNGIEEEAIVILKKNYCQTHEFLNICFCSEFLFPKRFHQ